MATNSLIKAEKTNDCHEFLDKQMILHHEILEEYFKDKEQFDWL